MPYVCICTEAKVKQKSMLEFTYTYLSYMLFLENSHVMLMQVDTQAYNPPVQFHDFIILL